MTDDNINLHITISSRKQHQARLFAYVAHMLSTGDNVSVWARNAMIAAIPKDWIAPPKTGNAGEINLRAGIELLGAPVPMFDDNPTDELSCEEID